MGIQETLQAGVQCDLVGLVQTSAQLKTSHNLTHVQKKANRNKTHQRNACPSCDRARNDRYTQIWIGMCCVDKSGSAELSEAIKSMFESYQFSDVRYAYLNDAEKD